MFRINGEAGYSGGPGNGQPSCREHAWEAFQATQSGLQRGDSHELLFPSRVPEKAPNRQGSIISKLQLRRWQSSGKT